MKLIISILFCSILLLCACKNNNPTIPSFLQSVDSIVLVCTAGHTNAITITNPSGIETFTEIISLRKEMIDDKSCNGKIEYYQNGKLILLAAYCGSSIKYESNGNNYAQRITYRAGMYFNEACSYTAKENGQPR